MSDANPSCSCILDCSGLYEVATTTSNAIRSLCIQGLADGTIAVPACVWQEFERAYPEEADEISQHISSKIRMQTKYKVKAASIADKMNSHLFLSPYDEQSDLYAASISTIEGYTLLTTDTQVAIYKKMKCGGATGLAAWAAAQQTH